MNNIRKKIINLIEPYMDKTLLLGTYMQYKENTNIYIQGNGQFINNDKVCDTYTIIGNYSITAVLKYISSLDYYPYPGADISNNFYIALGDKEIEHKREMDGKFFTLPNKPLQIYTEEEEKYLLDLLIKINKND